MNRIWMTRTTLLTGAALLLLVGCSSKPKPVAAPEAKQVPAPARTPVSTPVPTATPMPAAPTRITVEELNRRGYLKDAFFDFDRYNIRADQRDTLAKDGAWLKENPDVKFTIEGHCDERGTDQYNMALGQERAQAVKDYLVQLGVDSSRIQTISYGKERPFAVGHDEKAWAQNRRGHFLVTAN